ncbi:MAG: hypothetical protein K0S93_280 [Nitrososphaeraceae archaeon]|jgi:hypothetical protein|nr:hypothetical protein [Nitrososphaeraceae archaeon]
MNETLNTNTSKKDHTPSGNYIGGDQAGGNIVKNNIAGGDLAGGSINKIYNLPEISINKEVLAKLYPDYANAFNEVTNSINNELKKAKDIQPKQVEEIKHSIEELAKESEGISPDKQPDEQKKKSWKDKFKVFARSAIKALPKTASTLALFTPLTAPFSKNIEEALQPLVEGMQEGLK